MDFHELANLFPMIPKEELEQLTDDLRTNGLIEPITIYEGKILDGRNRFVACQMAQIEPEFVPYTGNNPLTFVISKNIQRRHLTSSQRAALAAQFEPVLAEEARQRQGQRTDIREIIPLSSMGKAVDHAANLFQTNGRYVQDAKAILITAPALFENVRDGLITIPQAKQEIARQRTHEPIVTPDLPDKVYSCIVIDPPWPIKKIEREERPNQGVELDYPTMTIEDIMNLPVSDLANESGCHLYLWVTQKYLPVGLEMVEAWGFRYQCLMTWRKNVGFTPFSWMYDTEHVIFATMGNLKLSQMGLRLSFDAPVNGHSVKPEVFFNERVLLASPEPRLEMFARRKREGFEVWGNEV